MIRTIKFVIFLAVLAIAGVFLYSRLHMPESKIEVSEGKINDVRTLVQLCSVDLYNEVPVLDTINNKVIFAVQKQRGSVSFDLENMKVDADGDTVKIVLPPEIVEINESTDDNSWQVIDTKNIGFMGVVRSDDLTNEEDNIVKAKARRKSMKLLYRNGTIRRARAEAAQNLRAIMAKVYRKPVIVSDPTPKGAHYRD